MGGGGKGKNGEKNAGNGSEIMENDGKFMENYGNELFPGKNRGKSGGKCREWVKTAGNRENGWDFEGIWGKWVGF